MEAKKYRKKPVEIEAVQLTDDADWGAIARWCGGWRRPLHVDDPSEYTAVMVVPTLHGDVSAYLNQWVCKGPRDCWPVDEETFAETYEAVDNG